MLNIQKLSSDLESVDQQLATSPSDDLSRRRVVLQTELDLIPTMRLSACCFILVPDTTNMATSLVGY